MKRLGIMSAMIEEIEQLVSDLEDKKTRSEGMREYHQGTLWGVPVVLAFSRMGKVAAATTATQFISEYKVDRLVFTGVAGGVAPEIQIGDVVIGTNLYQHDMDARPIFQRHEIPLLQKSFFSANTEITSKLEWATQEFLRNDLSRSVSNIVLNEFAIGDPKVRIGGIASGDQFINSSKKIADLRERLPDVLCVEMEGAAVAQVCYEYQVPFGIVRSISDCSREHAPIDFSKFIQRVARIYSHGILRRFVDS